MTAAIATLVQYEWASIRRRLNRKIRLFAASLGALTQSCVAAHGQSPQRVHIPHSARALKNPKGSTPRVGAILPRTPSVVSAATLGYGGPADAQLGERWNRSLNRPNELIVISHDTPGLCGLTIVPPAEAAYWLFPNDSLLCFGGPLNGALVPVKLLRYNYESVRFAGETYCFVRSLQIRPDFLSAVFLQWVPRV